MLNYRKGKKRYKVDELGSLYVKDSLDDNHRPTIYIGGQMEHRLHVLEQSGYTFDDGHAMFDGSWFYDYSIFSKNKECLNAQNFGNNLLMALEKAKLDDVDLITESYGGLIGLYATKSPRVHKVVAIHPPILGTPLADKDLIKEMYARLSLEQKALSKVIMMLIDDNYGFEKENSQGIYSAHVASEADISKFVVVGSSVDRESEKSPLVQRTSDLIYTLSGKDNDGVVIFDTKDLEKIGINYYQEEERLNHFEAGAKENIENAYKRVLKK